MSKKAADLKKQRIRHKAKLKKLKRVAKLKSRGKIRYTELQYDVKNTFDKNAFSSTNPDINHEALTVLKRESHQRTNTDGFNVDAWNLK